METVWNVELCWYLAGLVSREIGVATMLGGRAEGREEMGG